MFSSFRRTLPSLAGIASPRHVRIDGTVVSPNGSTSPITGFVASALRIHVYVRYVSDRQAIAAHSGAPSSLYAMLGELFRPRGIFDDGSEREVFEPLASFSVGREVVVETEGGHAVRIPWSDDIAWVSRLPAFGQPLERPLPAEWRRATLVPQATRGVICVGEDAITTGMRVRLEAFVGPNPRAAWGKASPFRAADSVPFVAIPERGVVRLIDLEPTAM